MACFKAAKPSSNSRRFRLAKSELVEEKASHLPQGYERTGQNLHWSKEGARVSAQASIEAVLQGGGVEWQGERGEGEGEGAHVSTCR